MPFDKLRANGVFSENETNASASNESGNPSRGFGEIEHRLGLVHLLAVAELGADAAGVADDALIEIGGAIEQRHRGSDGKACQPLAYGRRARFPDIVGPAGGAVVE